MKKTQTKKSHATVPLNQQYQSTKMAYFMEIAMLYAYLLRAT